MAEVTLGPGFLIEASQGRLRRQSGDLPLLDAAYDLLADDTAWLGSPNLTDPAALSALERHLAALFARGHSGRLVAYETGLAPSTVSQVQTSILRKLKLGSLAELVRVLGPRG